VQKVPGEAQMEMNLEMEMRASKPLHQSVQKCPSSRVRTSRWVLVQSREIAVVVEVMTILTTRWAKEP
jgi:hypothetical protein